MKNRLFNLGRHHTPATSGKSVQPDTPSAASVAAGAPGLPQPAGAPPPNGREAERAAGAPQEPMHYQHPSAMHTEKRQDDGAAVHDAAVHTAEVCHPDCNADYHHHHDHVGADGKPHFFSLCTKCAYDGKVRVGAHFSSCFALHHGIECCGNSPFTSLSHWAAANCRKLLPTIPYLLSMLPVLLLAL